MNEFPTFLLKTLKITPLELPTPHWRVREPNPKSVELLLGARDYLWDGRLGEPKTQFICHAIQDFVMTTGGGMGDACPIFSDIQQSMMRNGWRLSTYERWLVAVHQWDEHAIASQSEKIQAARLRWMNEMIVGYGGTP